MIYHSFSLLKEECSNNEAEYEALILGLLLALSMKEHSLRAHGDSQLVVRQINNIYEVRKPKLVPYYTVARKLMDKFEHVEVVHVPRSRNAPVDALAKLAAALVFQGDDPARIVVEERWLFPAVLELIPEEVETNTITTDAVDEEDWRQPFFDYFKHGSLPKDAVERRQLQRRLPSYIYKVGVLYKRSYGHEVLLRCVNRNEANEVLQEVQHGVCGGHQSGPKMYHSIRLVGYYWPGIMADCLKLKLVMAAKSTTTSRTNHQFHSTRQSLLGHSTLGESMSSASSTRLPQEGTISFSLPQTTFPSGQRPYHSEK